MVKLTLKFRKNENNTNIPLHQINLPNLHKHISIYY